MDMFITTLGYIWDNNWYPFF